MQRRNTPPPAVSSPSSRRHFLKSICKIKKFSLSQSQEDVKLIAISNGGIISMLWNYHFLVPLLKLAVSISVITLKSLFWKAASIISPMKHQHFSNVILYADFTPIICHAHAVLLQWIISINLCSQISSDTWNFSWQLALTLTPILYFVPYCTLSQSPDVSNSNQATVKAWCASYAIILHQNFFLLIRAHVPC